MTRRGTNWVCMVHAESWNITKLNSKHWISAFQVIAFKRRGLCAGWLQLHEIKFLAFTSDSCLGQQHLIGMKLCSIAILLPADLRLCVLHIQRPNIEALCCGCACGCVHVCLDVLSSAGMCMKLCISMCLKAWLKTPNPSHLLLSPIPFTLITLCSARLIWDQVQELDPPFRPKRTSA
jgi:hypothetical protein